MVSLCRGVCKASRWRQRNRARSPSRLRAQHRNITTTRWWLWVTKETLFYIFNSTVVDWTCFFFMSCSQFVTLGWEGGIHGISAFYFPNFPRRYFRCVRAIAKNDYKVHVCPSVRTEQLLPPPLGRFSWNLMFEYFSKSCRENSSFIKIGQE